MVEFSNEVVSDPIILRSTGIPVYNYVVVVDDALMKITHVIRGDDHLSNTPKQVALYEALGWPVPEFAHLSTILGADRERLSKRHGATSIANFRDMGVLPEALMNYLALLGWAPSGGTREIFTPDELKKEFSLERVTPSPAVFDMEKLYWLNRHYIKQSPPERIEKLALPFFVQAAFCQQIRAIRVAHWFGKWLRCWCRRSTSWMSCPSAPLDLPLRRGSRGELARQRRGAGRAEDARRACRVCCRRSRPIASPMTPERFKAIMNEVKAKTGAKGKDLFHPVRVVVTGSHSGPRVRQADSDSRGRLAAGFAAACHERWGKGEGVSGSEKRLTRGLKVRSRGAGERSSSPLGQRPERSYSAIFHGPTPQEQGSTRNRAT